MESEGEGHGFRQAANRLRAMPLERAFLGRVFRFQPAVEVPSIDLDHPTTLP